MDAKIIDFTAWANENMYGCKRCTHLQKIGKDTYTCNHCNDDKGNSIYPIVDGEKTEDYNLCDGEFLEKKSRRNA